MRFPYFRATISVLELKMLLKGEIPKLYTNVLTIRPTSLKKSDKARYIAISQF
jgi:hypothetical protein